jgi:hypothetical protein
MQVLKSPSSNWLKVSDFAQTPTHNENQSAESNIASIDPANTENSPIGSRIYNGHNCGCLAVIV